MREVGVGEDNKDMEEKEMGADIISVDFKIMFLESCSA